MRRSAPSACWAPRRPPWPRCPVPFAVVLGIALWRRPGRSCNRLQPRHGAPVEGATVGAQLDVRADRGAEWIELELVLPQGVTEVGAPAGQLSGSTPGRDRRLGYELACERWGAYQIGLVDVRVRSAFGLLSTTGQVDATLPLRAYPRRERLLRACRRTTRHRSRAARCPVQRGRESSSPTSAVRAPATVRRVNWRASARRERMYVNESHPERASDVILFLDSFAEARGSGEGTSTRPSGRRRRSPTRTRAPKPRRARQLRRLLRWLPPRWACASSTASSMRSSRPSWRARISRRRSK